MKNHFLKFVFPFCLLLVGCDKGSESKPIPPKSTGSTKQAHASPEVVRHFDTDSVFPETPSIPEHLSSEPDFTKLDESELIRSFEGGDTVNWSLILKEMERRETPQCLRSMATNITLSKGVSVISGEFISSPAHAAPVAIALIGCGNNARDALIEGAKNSQLDRRARILNLWVLRQLNPEAPASTDWIKADPSLESERQVLVDMLEIASDEVRLSELFPQDAPQN